MKRAALLIVDMQNDFIPESSPMKVTQARAIIPHILHVLEVFRSRHLPVFHLLRIHRADGSDVEIIRQELFRSHPFAVEGKPGAAIIDEIIPASGEYVIPKTRMSGFIATELDLMLQSLGINQPCSDRHPDAQLYPDYRFRCYCIELPGHRC